VSDPGDRPPLLAFAALAILVAGLLFVLYPRGAAYSDLLSLGAGYAGRAERTAAAAAYQEATRRRPADPLPHQRLARLYLEWGRLDEALASLSQAEQLDADPEDIERLRVSAYVARAEAGVVGRPAEWEAAARHARSLLALDPSADEARHVLARAYLGVRAWGAAASVYEELLGRDPEDALAHERLGLLLLGEDSTALEHLAVAGTDLAEKALAVYGEATAAENPAYGAILIARLLMEREEWPLAAHQLQRAVADSPDYGEASAYLGHALDRMGYPEGARNHLRRAVGEMPESAVAHAFLGLHYDRLGDIARARGHYETAYDLAPNNPAICVEIGQTWVAEGRYEVAGVWLREAVSLQPEAPEFAEILARFYLDHTITSEGRAVEATEALLALSPEDAVAHDLRGWAAVHFGDYEAAEKHLWRAIALDPQLASAHYHLGVLRNDQGRQDEADRAFARAVDLDTTGALSRLVERARAARARPAGAPARRE
jgi:tetratricopeptide (TPR) repeat protein